MKYVCTVCGYVYDEETEGTPFSELPSDWVCPLCGAEKGMFEPAEKKEEAPAEPKPAEPAAAVEYEAEDPDDWKELNRGEISALFSNLARGAEKQYENEAAECYRKVADWFETHDKAGKPDMDYLASLVKNDLDVDYQNLKKEAERVGDRGTLRALTWGSKVTMIAQTLIKKYQREGDKLLDGTSLWMCTVCGFLFIGKQPPELCPVCKVPAWKFERIGGKA